MAEDYYRALFDLQLTEFHLWQWGLIPDDVMETWLRSRNKSYTTKEQITVTPKEGPPIAVGYAETWRKLSTQAFGQTPYFDNSDRFVLFLNDVHVQVKFNFGPIRARWKKEKKP